MTSDAKTVIISFFHLCADSVGSPFIAQRSAPKVSKNERNHVTTEVIKNVISYIRVRARLPESGTNPRSFLFIYF